jgi:hypothetical protein
MTTERTKDETPDIAYDVRPCRYCGSPTIDGLHRWGWTACMNYRKPTPAEDTRS